MLKKIGPLLVYLLAAISIFMGLMATLSPTITAFYNSNGSLLLCTVILVFTIVVILLWFPIKKKRLQVKPETSITLQGHAFRLWFSGHNLSWALGFSLFHLFLLTLFGPTTWVILFGAGTLACISFAVLGLVVGAGTQTLGLCWQSPVPGGIGSYPEYAAASVILRQRYEHAVTRDQERPEPMLWSIT
ncbi:MAG: hypothetical protein GY757_19525, partial [bacterium]|nr:hypothetical protein [bacterium]